jgi:hypothetical protein
MLKSGSSLAIVSKWNKEQYGSCSQTSKNIENYWFILMLLNNSDYPEIQEYYEFYSRHNNYPVYIEIVDYYYLPGNEMVGVCKTFWLKIIQRKWKKIYAERKRIEKSRTHISEILYYQRHGSWRHGLNTIPSIKGMLAK